MQNTLLNCSNSKAFCQALLLCVSDEGKVKRDDKVINTSKFQRCINEYVTMITIRDLLTQQKWIGSWRWRFNDLA
jgi:CubicO group peptidase (beta-lactamase class C family)